MGCGWFGLPFAEHLISEGWKVNGSTTTEAKVKSLQKAGVNSYVLEMNHNKYEENLREFLNSELLLINIPPKPLIRNEAVISHSEQIKLLVEVLVKSPVKSVIYISSTSVYKNNNDIVNEDEKYNVSKGRGMELLSAENLLKNIGGIKTTVLRFAGLYGYSRVPLRKSKDSIIVRDNKPMNLLHLDDAIKVVNNVIQNKVLNKTYNVCQDEHPTREEFIKANPVILEDRKLVLDINPVKYKIVSNDKIKRELLMRFRSGYKL